MAGLGIEFMLWAKPLLDLNRSGSVVGAAAPKYDGNVCEHF
jgi:hypothetical protein